MITVEPTEAGVRATDSSRRTLDVRGEGWRETSSGPILGQEVHAEVSGAATELRFPPVFVVAERLDDGARFELGSEEGPLTLPDGQYLVRIDGNVLAYVRFDGRATLAKPGYESVVVGFPEQTAVTLGFKSRVMSPPETMTVPPTPEGVALALTSFPAGHHTGTPDRSFRTMRGHPPLVAFGDEVDVPEVVAERREEPTVSLTLPRKLSYLFTASSLAHYLGAEVRVEAGATPTLRAPGVARELPPLPDFQYETASLLRRTFLLDCLVRNAGPHGTDLAESDLLEPLGLDDEALYHSDVGTRFSTYLDAPFERVDDDLPPWHLSMYIEPTMEHVRCLPCLLHNVPNVFLPEAESLEEKERLVRSLDDFYRGVGTASRSESAPSVDLLKPKLGPGRVHGWLADGAPIDAYRTVPEAYQNVAKYRERASGPISFVVVLNDDDMVDERDEVAQIYRDRASDLDLDLEIAVRRDLGADELRDVFEAPHDLVHYIGHCEEEGLRCPDGYFAAADLDECRVQTFFLNACGSYYEGLDLVRKGSVAGAVTFNRVLDANAARVGTAFARLLARGFSIVRALQMARRRVMMGKDYTVVGDGTYVLTQSDNYVSSETTLERLGEDRFRVTYNAHSPWTFGGYYQSHLQTDGRSHLHGVTQEFELTRAELFEFFNYGEIPIVYDGDLRWSSDLEKELR